VGCEGYFDVDLGLLTGSERMSNSQEKRVNRIAATKGYRLEKVGKGTHHGRFSIVKISEGSRAPSGIAGDPFSFSIEEAEAWLTKDQVSKGL
jgi:hypothetical protein